MSTVLSAGFRLIIAVDVEVVGTGRRFTIHMDCGHVRRGIVTSAEVQLPKPGQLARCLSCACEGWGR